MEGLLTLFFLLIGAAGFSYSQYVEIKQLKTLVATDPLTGLLNRRAFLEVLTRLVDLLPAVRGEYRKRSLSTLSVFFIDLDYFKKVNDNWGHAVGDEVLREVAKTLRKKLRESDIICRWGGEEIVVALPNLHADEAVEVAEKIRRAVAKLTFSELSLQVTVSIGVATATQYESGNKLITYADKAVYQAKEKGRDRVVLYH